MELIYYHIFKFLQKKEELYRNEASMKNVLINFDLFLKLFILYLLREEGLELDNQLHCWEEECRVILKGLLLYHYELLMPFWPGKVIFLCSIRR